MPKPTIFLIVVLLLLFIFIPGGSALAQGPEFEGPIVPCGVVSEGQPSTPFSCQACQLVSLSQNVINFIIFLATVIAILMFVYAGFLYITAGGDPGKVTKAHKIFWAVFIGFIIVLSAWLFINFLLTSFLKADFKPWESILCKSAGSNTGNTGSNTGNTGVVVAPPPGTGNSSSQVGTIYNFTTDPNIDKQLPHASSRLDSLLRCMSDQVPSGVGNISSISDSVIVDGNSTFGECALTGCSHKSRSCHYGGRTCVGRSYAVDFNDMQNATVLSQAARTCDSGAKIINEGNHIHVSIGIDSGCGCN